MHKGLKKKKLRDFQRARMGDSFSCLGFEPSSVYTPFIVSAAWVTALWGSASPLPPALHWHYLCCHCERLHDPGRSLNQHRGGEERE